MSLDRYPLPILRVADVMEGRIQSPSSTRTLDIDHQKLGPKTSKHGDVVLTVKGTVGRVAVVPLDSPTYAYSPQLCYFRPHANGPLNSRYLYYWFKSNEFWEQADALKGQTDMADFISLSDVHALKIKLPSLKVQEAVASVLGSFDDKIAANHRIRGMVDELLRSRFSHLAEGRGVTEMRLIARVNVEQTKPRTGQTLRYLDISAVGQGVYEFPSESAWDDAPGRARRVVHHGDTVWSTVRPNRRSHALILDDDSSLVASTGLAVLTPDRAV